MKEIPVYTHQTIVVGSGCAGYNAADSLYRLGLTDVAIVTEGRYMGTSRNTGSDKQTYYKINTSGNTPDSVERMAKSYLSGGSMNGDTALVEAASSLRCFYKLVQLGVAFPENEFGEFVGYQTDHDDTCRATSCGPLTSKYMTEALEREVFMKGIPLYDGYRVVEIVKKDNRAIGLIALKSPENEFVLFSCTNIIYAAGGPAGLYAASVYPESQTGAHGAALAAGVKGVNLTEWQFGIASTKFRWNLSGSYQQVLPRYVSYNQNGNEEREFLTKYFDTETELLKAVFLKGFQWPFDVRKQNGSSKIDLAVYHETQELGRRVFLDYSRNPLGIKNLKNLPEQVRRYLQKSGAVSPAKPIDRLKTINEKAYRLYLEHGIDLSCDLVEIDVCAQHNNGGLFINSWSESNLAHFFVCGEAAGVFGVYRPGGSALNSTQVTSLRAAQYIAMHYTEKPDTENCFKAAQNALHQLQELSSKLFQFKQGADSVSENRARLQQRMSKYGGIYRSNLKTALAECKYDILHFAEQTNAGPFELTQAFINRDLLHTQYACLAAMLDFQKSGGVSRGSALYQNVPVTDDPDKDLVNEIQCSFNPCHYTFQKVPVRPFPKERTLWFEQIYN